MLILLLNYLIKLFSITNLVMNKQNLLISFTVLTEYYHSSTK